MSGNREETEQRPNAKFALSLLLLQFLITIDGSGPSTRFCELPFLSVMALLIHFNQHSHVSLLLIQIISNGELLFQR